MSKNLTINNVGVSVFDDKTAMGNAAAELGATYIRQAIADRGEATIIVATGASQFEVLAALVEQPDIAWDRVTAFHLDEYIGLSIQHPASFRLYLWQRFVSRLPVPLKSFTFIDAEHDAEGEIKRLNAAIAGHKVDVAFVGIGENAHLAFNDPPADFDADGPYLIVDLDEACRQQQAGEGWFATLDDVPKQAISMSVKHIMATKAIVCTVPDDRKSQAVHDSLQGEVSPSVPASILQRHPQVSLFLDAPAACKLSDI